MARFIAADVSRSEDVVQYVAAACEAWGRIDVFMNNAAWQGAVAPIVDYPDELFDRVMAINVRGVFLGLKHVLPVMQSQGKGVIVNVASVAGVRDQPGRQYIAYAASKAGVIRMSKAVAIDNARRGIRCNTVVPGLMNTPLVSERLARQIGGNDAAKLIAERNARVPIGEMGDGWDVAHAVLFLASDEAKHITATEIVVDGGLTAPRP